MTETTDYENVRTFCPQSRRMVNLQLRKLKTSPTMILGVPTSCCFESDSCSRTSSCMLKAQQILTRRDKT